MDIVHTLGILHEYETSKSYTVQDFLRVTRRSQAAATVVACDLCYIPSRSSSYHEFLLVHMEGLKLIIERVPTNNRTQVISSSGGIARDTVTAVREREQHEYWQGRLYVVFKEVVFGVWELQTITGPTPRRSPQHYLPRFTPSTTYPPFVGPANETERHAHACLFITPDLLHGLAAFVAIILRSLPQLTLPEPVVDVTNHDRTSGGMPESSQHMESH
ncbi:hypothetical protein EDD15DRAFT_2200567 [Pisolithus albus]|nr:hypothetical protein EDD15DRAFT_2200567 [Pisolithus albus]